MDPGANQIEVHQKQTIRLSKIEMAAVVFNFALLHVAIPIIDLLFVQK